MLLITGGTGTVGQEIVHQSKDDIKVISRNEVAQIRMKEKYPNVEYIIGDIRNYKALKRASKGVDIIYHLAAIKHVPVCENQPEEAIKTNVFGTINAVRAAKRNFCDLVFLSTDKAENPNSQYGNTKAMAERIVLGAGFTVVRTGNIFGSSGSVIPLFINQIKTKNELKLTDGKMTRFFISVENLVEFILSLKTDNKIFYPEMYAYFMSRIAKECIERYGNKETKIIYTGARPGEKKHEELNGIRSLDKLGSELMLKKLFDNYDKRQGYLA